MPPPESRRNYPVSKMRTRVSPRPSVSLRSRQQGVRRIPSGLPLTPQTQLPKSQMEPRGPTIQTQIRLRTLTSHFCYLSTALGVCISTLRHLLQNILLKVDLPNLHPCFINRTGIDLPKVHPHSIDTPQKMICAQFRDRSCCEHVFDDQQVV